MRLSEYERDIILEAQAVVFGPDVRVVLFCSRVDDSRRGGDIDLFVEPADSVDIMTKKWGSSTFDAEFMKSPRPESGPQSGKPW